MANTADSPKFDGVKGWIDHRLPIFTFMQHSLVDYPTPRNLSYWWNFGSLAGICLVVQILTGVFLAMNYTAHVDYAFESVERIMRDVNYGWLMRYLHANGASMFFLVTYIHIFRGLFYGSYKAPREVLWWLGIVILLMMMASAFIGYVLPWGQMSYWGATVITNLFSAFPLIGDSIVTWLWGGFSVDNPTLNRFFSLHYLLPILLVGVVFMHLWALHTHGSNNPLGIDAKGPQDKIPFHPYYTIKDFFGFGVFFLLFAYFVFFAPNFLGHPDNYIPANPMVTPAHIVPEWYFLPFYAILRAVTFNIPLFLLGLAIVGGVSLLIVDKVVNGSRDNDLGWVALAMAFVFGAAFAALAYFDNWNIPSKLGGVLAMFGAILVLFALPWLDSSKVRSGHFRPIYKWVYWIFVLCCIGLGYFGGKPAEGLYVIAAQVLTGFYFSFFLIILPLLGRIEKPLPLPKSIGEAVLGGGKQYH